MFGAYPAFIGLPLPMPRRTSFRNDDYSDEKGFRASTKSRSKSTSIFSRFRRSSTQPSSSHHGSVDTTRKTSLPPTNIAAHKSAKSQTSDMTPPPYYKSKDFGNFERSSSIASTDSSYTSSSEADGTSLPFLQTESPTDNTLVLTKTDNGDARLMTYSSLSEKRGSVGRAPNRRYS